MAYAFASLSTILSTSSAINELPSYSDISPQVLSDYFVIDTPDKISGVYKTKKVTYDLFRDIIFYDVLSQAPLTYSVDLLTKYISITGPTNSSIIGTLTGLVQRVTYMERRTEGLFFGTISLSSHAHLALSGGDKKVGIGTSTPNEKLTVNGNISSNGTAYNNFLVVNGVSSIPQDGYIDIKGPNTSNNVRLQQTNGGLSIYTNNENTTPKIKVDYLGNVGINTEPDPVYKLKVNGKLNVAGGDVSVNAPNKFVGYGTIPIGGIIMWSGTIASIPTGWSLCNGSNGTPDLRNRFIVGAGSGAGSEYTPGNVGGSKNLIIDSNHIPYHTHTINDPGHFHFVAEVKGSDAGASETEGGDVEYQRGTSPRIRTETSKTGITINPAGSEESQDPLDNRPPYYALAFIMRTL